MLKKFIKNFFNIGNAGVSLVELLISVGMLGGVAITVSELMRQTGDVTSKVRTRYDESEFLMGLHDKLMQPTICEKNFPVGELAEKTAFPSGLLDIDDSVLAIDGAVYGENEDLTISRISSTY